MLRLRQNGGKMKKLIICIASLLLSASCFSCEKKQNDKLSIVTTCFPPYDFARAVAGDSADIKMLLSSGAEAHSYEPAPMDIAAIQNCDVFICIGNEDEVWVDRILDSIDTSGIKIVRLIDHVNLLEEEPVAGASPDGHDHHHHEHEHEHEHDEQNDSVSVEHADGHIWTSPSNAILCLESVKDALCETVPDSSSLYMNNYDNYCKKLTDLDTQLLELMNNAERNEIVIADRFPFRYLAHDYGIEYFAAFSGCSSESEPSVYTMAFLMDEIKEHDMDYVFTLEFSTKKLAEKLCTATGAEMLTLHSCHNVSKSDFKNGVTYVELMQNNISSLKEALC
ncbi:MAG: zinc ABC transporter substrate-binding protein [Ruminococcus sp.]|nr:zinc ABC transporter substrate-binding protein [Ruminococcus sp.]